jgi:hypothetical protein
MRKFVKTTVVEAIQIKPENAKEINALLGRDFDSAYREEEQLRIITPFRSQNLTVKQEEWLIKYRDGGFACLSDEIFKANYDPME